MFRVDTSFILSRLAENAPDNYVREDFVTHVDAISVDDLQICWANGEIDVISLTDTGEVVLHKLQPSQIA